MEEKEGRKSESARKKQGGRKNIEKKVKRQWEGEEIKRIE